MKVVLPQYFPHILTLQILLLLPLQPPLQFQIELTAALNEYTAALNEYTATPNKPAAALNKPTATLNKLVAAKYTLCRALKEERAAAKYNLQLRRRRAATK